MTQNKKAQVEVSFNWVFILIAGAVILFFFLRLITTEMDVTQTATQQRTITRMNSLLTALQQNPDSISIRDRLNQEIQFECPVGNHEYGIPGSSARTNLPHQIVFTPKTIGESRPIAWVKSFNSPFPITSILYLTDQKTHYAFLKDADTEDNDANNIIEHYYNLLPDNISKSYMSLSELSDKLPTGYNRYIIIAHENIDEESLNGIDNRLRNTNDYIIKIRSDRLTFQKQSESNEEYSDLPEELILGAIISGDEEIFECVINKLLNQIRIITDINLKRIEELYAAYPQGTCKPLYSSILQDPFGDLSNAAKVGEFQNIKKYAETIRLGNKNLLSVGCATIY